MVGTGDEATPTIAEEDRVTPIASGRSAFSTPPRQNEQITTPTTAIHVVTPGSLLHQQPFIYPPSNDDDSEDDVIHHHHHHLDVHELERELRSVSSLTPGGNVQRPVPVGLTPVYSEDSLDNVTVDDQTKEKQRQRRKRRQRWKQHLREEEDEYDENDEGCAPRDLFPFVSAFRNELVDVLDKLGQGCGSLDEDSEEEEEEEDSDHSLDEEDDDEDSRSTAQTQRSTGAIGRGVLQDSMSDVTARTKYQMKDQQFLHTFITMFTQTGLVVWQHHTPTKYNGNGGGSSSRPTKCLAFLQPGHAQQSAAASDGPYQAPWLVWKPVDVLNTTTAAAATDTTSSGNNNDAGVTVNIFSIRSLYKATALQLKEYPLAMPGRTVILETTTTSSSGADDNETPPVTPVILEMRSEEDAFKLVHGIRWIVARLSFNLIIGNLSVSCEMLDVERKEKRGRFGQMPSNATEESQWMSAMNDLTSELVRRATMTTHSGEVCHRDGMEGPM